MSIKTAYERDAVIIITRNYIPFAKKMRDKRLKKA